MTTLTELRADVRSHLDESISQFWENAELDRWINEALRDVARRTEVLQAIKSYAVKPDQQTYKAPDDMLRIYRVEFNVSSDYNIALEYQPFLNMDNIWYTSRTVSGAIPYYWCVDLETEILTRRGFKRHDEVIIGEEVYTLDPSGVGAWVPLQDVRVFDGPVDVVEMSGRGHHSISTPNHRWLVEKRSGQRAITTTSELTDDDLIVCAATDGGFYETPKWGDEFVELVAWAWTEGSWRRGRYEAISQSSRANPDKVARIDACLTRAVGPGLAALPRDGTEQAWRRYQSRPDMTMFAVSAQLARDLEAVAPQRRVSYSFLNDLTVAQLRLFVDTSIDADGSWRDGAATIFQSEVERLEPLQFACARLGLRSVLHEVDGGYRLAIHKRRGVRPVKAAAHGSFTIQPATASEVWCPRTPTGTWFARRSGTTYFTGNTIWGTPGVGDQQLYLYPAPSDNRADALRVFYYRLPRKMVQDEDPADIPVGWEDLVPLYVEVVARRKESKDMRWKEALELYEVRLDQMMATTRHWTDQQHHVGEALAGGGRFPFWAAGADEYW